MNLSLCSARRVAYTQPRGVSLGRAAFSPACGGTDNKPGRTQILHKVCARAYTLCTGRLIHFTRSMYLLCLTLLKLIHACARASVIIKAACFQQVVFCQRITVVAVVARVFSFDETFACITTPLFLALLSAGENFHSRKK